MEGAAEQKRKERLINTALMVEDTLELMLCCAWKTRIYLQARDFSELRVCSVCQTSLRRKKAKVGMQFSLACGRPGLQPPEPNKGWADKQTYGRQEHKYRQFRYDSPQRQGSRNPSFSVAR